MNYSSREIALVCSISEFFFQLVIQNNIKKNAYVTKKKDAIE